MRRGGGSRGVRAPGRAGSHLVRSVHAGSDAGSTSQKYRVRRRAMHRRARAGGEGACDRSWNAASLSQSGHASSAACGAFAAWSRAAHISVCRAGLFTPGPFGAGLSVQLRGEDRNRRAACPPTGDCERHRARPKQVRTFRAQCSPHAPPFAHAIRPPRCHRALRDRGLLEIR